MPIHNAVIAATFTEIADLLEIEQANPFRIGAYRKAARIARARGLKLNEYGVFRGTERIAGATEEEVYRALGLTWIPPESREDRGEIEAARLPAEATP